MKINKIVSVLLSVLMLFSMCTTFSAEAPTTEILPISVEPIPISIPDAELTSTTAATPVGHLDEVSISQIRGWAWRSDIPNTPIVVHIYLTNTTTNQQWGYAVTADQYRVDLENAGYGNGCHAFVYPINWLTYPPGQYSVTAYALGANDNNPALYECPRYYTVRPMESYVDYVNEYGTGGWLWKPDAPNERIHVHAYVYRANGDYVNCYVTVANEARLDLAEMNYGDGAHGFTLPIPWGNLPKERLRLTIYAVDGSGYHPSIYNEIYDNSKIIRTYGVIDQDNYNHSAWVTDEVNGYFEDIGYTEFHEYNSANATDLINYAQNSYFSVFATHGSPTSIAWCTISDTGVQRGSLTTSQLNSLPSDYFKYTKCLLLLACSTASGGASNTNNLVNTFLSKGVETVVGFKDVVYFTYDNNLNVSTNMFLYRWGRDFTQRLSEGATVQQAVGFATSRNEVNLKDPAIKGTYYGLDSCYIAGNANLVIKS